MDYYDTSPDTVESVDELKKKMYRLRNRGIPLLSAIVLFLPLMIILPREMAEAIFLPGLVLSVVIFIVGAFVLTQSSIWKTYLYSINILLRLSPPDPVITEVYAVLKQKESYIFVLRSAPEAMYYMVFNQSGLSYVEDIDVPKTFWKWNSALHIEGIKAHNRKGPFSIPTPEGKIIRGEGILLAVPTTGRAYMLHVPDFSRDQLLTIADFASVLISGETEK
jgi:hypothetical protein